MLVIPSDSPSIFDQLTTAEGLAIVRPNNPPPGIAGFLFDFNGDEEIRLRSIITKHYTEAGTPVQDQAALEPEEIILKGLIAELSTGLPAPIPQAPVKKALPLHPGLVPQFATGPLQTLLASATGQVVSGALRANGLGSLAGAAGGITSQIASGNLSGAASGAAGLAVSVGVSSAFSGASPRLQGALASAVSSTLSGGLTPSTVAASALSVAAAVGVPPAAIGILSTLVTNVLKSGAPQNLGAATAAAAGFLTPPASQGLYQYYQNNTPQQPGQTKQSNAFAYLYQLWLGRALFSVETAFGVMNNMMILDGRALQEADSREKSLFTVTFQKVRIAGNAVILTGQLAGRRVFQAAPTVPTGISSQIPISTDQQTAIYQSFA